MVNRFIDGLRNILLAGTLMAAPKTIAVEPTRILRTPQGNLEKVVDVPNETGVLVHVRQKHLIPYLESSAKYKLDSMERKDEEKTTMDLFKDAIIALDFSPRVLRSVNNCQRQIYKFIQGERVERIYAEGIQFGRGLSPEEAKKSFVLVHSLLVAVQDLEKREKSVEKYFFCPGAVYLLAKAGTGVVGVDVSKKERTLGLEKLSLGDSSEIMQERESKATSYVLGDAEGERYRILIYGADHEFKDDVEKWNKEHLDQQYDFATFTPKELIEVNLETK